VDQPLAHVPVEHRQSIDRVHLRAWAGSPQNCSLGAGGQLVCRASSLAIRAPTTTVPLHCATGWWPKARTIFASGLVQSVAHPGRTGLTTVTGPENRAKDIQLLKDIVPRMSRVAYLQDKLEYPAWLAQGIRGVERATGVRVSRRKRRQAGPMPRGASR
jgi:hypothetical protein